MSQSLATRPVRDEVTLARVREIVEQLAAAIERLGADAAAARTEVALPQRRHEPLERAEERARRKGHDFYHRLKYQTRADRYEAIRRSEPAMQVTRGYESMFGVQTRNPAGDAGVSAVCKATK